MSSAKHLRDTAILYRAASVIAGALRADLVGTLRHSTTAAEVIALADDARMVLPDMTPTEIAHHALAAVVEAAGANHITRPHALRRAAALLGAL